MVFVIRKSKNALRRQRWYFTAVGRNGEIIVTSEMYQNRTDAYEAIELLQREAALSRIDER